MTQQDKWKQTKTGPKANRSKALQRVEHLQPPRPHGDREAKSERCGQTEQDDFNVDLLPLVRTQGNRRGTDCQKCGHGL